MRDKHVAWSVKIYNNIHDTAFSASVPNWRFGHVWYPCYGQEEGIYMDVTKALYKKREALQNEARAIEREAKTKIEEIKTRIHAVDAAIETVNEALKDCVCPMCHGTGTVHHCDAAGQMESEPCKDCHGTGISA